MYKIVRVYKTRLNDDYTGVIHMARYINSLKLGESGIIFLEQDFANGHVINKGSFFGDEDSCLLDKKTIEEDFGVKINFQYGQGEFISSIYYDGDSYFLYDDSLGTEDGKNISFEEAQINEPSLRSIFYRFNRAKKIVEDDDYLGSYDSITGLESQIAALRSTTEQLENQVAYIKKQNRDKFARKMDRR